MASSPRSRLSREDRMEQMLDRAHNLFAERGYAAVTMDEIAAEAGITKPLIYNYFGNKEQLYIACMERSGDALVESISGAVADAEDPSAAFEAGVRAFFEFLDTDRDAWAVLFDETLPHGGEVIERVSVYRRQLRDFAAQSTLAGMPGKLRDRESVRTEVEAASTAVLGAAEAVARWWLQTGSITASEAADLLIATVEPGLRSRALGSSTP
ncbi:MAG: TetR/AcrR family transcriptional regulator [Solirubrobacterales bacterium]|nr:TetR/AcrR family transcriptional regulator [Solirubrobacterales bacterium]